MGDESDISHLLKAHKPRIVVGEDGGEVPLSLTFCRPSLNFLSGGDWRKRTLIPECQNGFAVKRDSR